MHAWSASALFDLICSVIMFEFKILSLVQEGRELKTEAQ